MYNFAMIRYLPRFHIAQSSGPKSNKYKILGEKGLCATPKLQEISLKLCILDFIWQPLILKKVEEHMFGHPKLEFLQFIN